MYFTDTENLRRYEREMKKVPNFDRKEIWEHCDSCIDCKNYEFKLEDCVTAYCPYIKRKIRSNFVVTMDMVRTFLSDNAYIPFSNRVAYMLIKYKGNKLFLNKEHKVAFEQTITGIPEDDYNHVACMYVLALRPHIREHTVHTSKGYVCMSSDIKPKDKVLINFANDLYLGTKKLYLKEISYHRNVSDSEFIYICNAILIRRFGIVVIKRGD
ncbi:hypothetical protein [Ruminococcus sp. zg-924]|uniref:hypothetical protein n=1 Tax=Ruminococcus sp. zg-924 TaxID=2678505 RepID=UPI00210DE279|nr:hypothetical protein [Ruminococcus sp. zg-924]MCQ4022869.1 hypothetical protein [Ruminococcus sp. zg-924]